MGLGRHEARVGLREFLVGPADQRLEVSLVCYHARMIACPCRRFDKTARPPQCRTLASLRRRAHVVHHVQLENHAVFVILSWRACV
jgi:hypothetical protein